MASTWAVVPAAGRSTRMGNAVNKQLLGLAGRPVVEHALRALLAVPVDGIVLVVTPGREQDFARALHGLIRSEKIYIVPGGADRGESVRQGLLALPTGVELVVVHDGARPLVKPEHTRRAMEEAIRWGAATLAVPVKDTVKMAGPDKLVRQTLSRELLWQVQTPQVFKLDLLLEAHRTAQREGYSGTDDAYLVERIGRPVKLVPGSYSNIKITTPEDFLLAQILMEGRA